MTSILGYADVLRTLQTDPEEPVSYTHLDVYKRQVWAPAARRARSWWLAACPTPLRPTSASDPV